LAPQFYRVVRRDPGFAVWSDENLQGMCQSSAPVGLHPSELQIRKKGPPGGEMIAFPTQAYDLQTTRRSFGAKPAGDYLHADIVIGKQDGTASIC
jgi:hypothetical protein